MKTIFYIILVVIAFGCSSEVKQKGLVYYTDFENLKGWTHPLFLRKKNAHSGDFCNRVDTGITMYGCTFSMKFREIISTKVKKVKLSFWAFLPDSTTKGKFVIDVTGGPERKNLFWMAKDIDPVVAGYGKWVEIKADYTFVEKEITAPDNIIKIYPWNELKKPFYIDDVRIEFVI